MGQILNSIDSRLPPDVLQTPVQPQCGVLTGWTLLEVRRLYERYRRHSSSSGHYLPLSLFRSITRNSPLEGFSDSCHSFERGADRSVNVLELICALVVFAAADWENKATYLMRTFDFDGNKCLSHDEITILCAQVINGFASVTGCPRLLSSQLSALSDQVFSEADSTPDGLVTYDEVKLWMRLTPDLFQLFSSAPAPAEDPEMVFLFMHETVQLDKLPQRPGKTHRKNPSMDTRQLQTLRQPPAHATNGGRKPGHGRSNSDLPVVKPNAISIKGSLVTKEQVIGIKQVYDLLKNGHSFEEVKAGVLSGADLKRVGEAVRGKSLSFDELLVKVFKGVSQKDLRVLQQWVLEYEQDTPKKEEPVLQQVSFNSLAEFQYLFDIYDTNKNGELSLLELKSALSHMFSTKDIEQMFTQYDENHDDKISLTEFMKMMAPEGKEVTFPPA